MVIASKARMQSKLAFMMANLLLYNYLKLKKVEKSFNGSIFVWVMMEMMDLFWGGCKMVGN
jgi:hypothetical protein